MGANVNGAGNEADGNGMGDVKTKNHWQAGNFNNGAKNGNVRKYMYKYVIYH